MSEQEFESYLRLLSRFLRLSGAQREAIGSELRDHMEQRLAELLEQGYSREDAVEAALDEFGDAAALAADFGRISRRRKWIMRTSAGTIGIAATILIVSFLLPQSPSSGPAPAYTQAAEESSGSGMRSVAPETIATPPRALVESPENARVRAQLARVLPRVDFPEGTAFEEVIAFLGEQSGLSFSVNWNALAMLGIDRDTDTMGIALRDVKMETAIEILLANIGGSLDIDIAYDILGGVVRVSTREDLDRLTFVRVYDCRDLIDRPMTEAQREAIRTIAREYQAVVTATRPAGGGGWPSYHGGGMGGGMDGGMVGGGYGGGGLGGYGGGRAGGDDDDDEAGISDPALDAYIRHVFAAIEERHEERAEAFIELIRTHVTPDRWQPDGTIASVSAFDGRLVIGHTASGHEQVLRLIEMLREAQAPRPAASAQAAMGMGGR